MTNSNIIRILNVVAVIAATIGGASTIPNLNLPAPLLAYGLLVAMICKAVTSELLQVKGESDESQGISPQQVAMSQAVHAQAAAPPVVTKDPVTGITTITPAAPTPIVVATTTPTATPVAPVITK